MEEGNATVGYSGKDAPGLLGHHVRSQDSAELLSHMLALGRSVPNSPFSQAAADVS